MTTTIEDVTIGDGDSLNIIGSTVNGPVIYKTLQFMRARPAFYLTAEEIDDRVTCHVPARNHDRVLRALESERAVLLGGPEGSGRETAFITAVRKLSPDVPVRRFSADEEDPEEIRDDDACAYVVRFKEAGPEGVRRCLEAARATGRYVAVIGTGDQCLRLGVPVAFVELEPPDPVQVYWRRLVVHGRVSPGWSDWAGAGGLLAGALPADARRLAGIVEEVDRSHGFGEAARNEVVRAYLRWENELRDWFGRWPEPRDRTLMIAAAALEPATDLDVYTAALALARRLQVEVNGAGLAWSPAAGLRELLEGDDDSGRIVFRRHGFARSVLQHVWEDYPLARPDLLAWLTELVLDQGLAEEPRTRIAEAFAELAADHGQAALICDAARRWAQAELADQAFVVLARSCLHPHVGGAVRGQLYDWSRNGQIAQTLKLVIARVCEPLGEVHPSIALTRLKHLGTRGNPQVRAEVAAAALGLARSEYDVVLDAALHWCEGPGRESLSRARIQRRAHTGALVFVALAAERSETGLPIVLEHVAKDRWVPAWRAVLASLPAAVFADVVRAWLDAALASPTHRPGITEGFAEAGQAAPEPMVALVEAWMAEDPGDMERRRVGEDVVLGLVRPFSRWLARFVRVWAWELFVARRAG
ncbi:hypothetical protein ACSNOI_38970 [Actinomadura kijaniata]|uniref:hypothetical protein n=1 Tax=Actinomadura kijaniata TaxID=46161 RepID=UPI003F1B091C